MPLDRDAQDGDRMTDTRKQLIDLVDLAALLPALLTTRTAPASGSRRAGEASIANSPSPVRLDVLQALDGRLRDSGDDAEDRAWHDRMAGEHRQGLLPDLWQWARMIEAEAMETSPELPAELPETPTLTSVIEWLLQHLDWALAQPWAVELVRDVDWWWRRVRHLAGERDPYRPRCRRCLFPVEPIVGLVVEGHTPGMWRCSGCGNETSLDAALSRLAEPLVTLRQAAEITGVPFRTLQSRVRNGRLLAVTSVGERPALFRLRDVRADSLVS